MTPRGQGSGSGQHSVHELSFVIVGDELYFVYLPEIPSRMRVRRGRVVGNRAYITHERSSAGTPHLTPRRFYERPARASVFADREDPKEFQLPRTKAKPGPAVSIGFAGAGAETAGWWGTTLSHAVSALHSRVLTGHSRFRVGVI